MIIPTAYLKPTDSSEMQGTLATVCLGLNKIKGTGIVEKDDIKDFDYFALSRSVLKIVVKLGE